MDQNKKKLAKYLGAFVVVCSVFIVGLLVGRNDRGNLDILGDNTTKYTISGDVKSQYKNVDVNILWETWDEIDKEYINSNLDAQKMMYGAVKGLVASLDDPYTNFLTPDETKDYLKTNAGEYEGIGATLKQDGDYVAIESPVDKSPAQQAGILAGDIILEVDGKDISKKTVYDAVALIRGKAGTTVHLKIYRSSTKKELEFDVVRAAINIDNISMEKLDNGYVKIKILRFTEADVNAFNALWDKTMDQVLAANPKGLVIDLRNNPGGYVSGVEYVLGEFLPKGSVIFMEQNKGGSKLEHKVTRDGKLLNIPMVVLVNQGSASASEIFTTAIQDYSRGKVVGMPTVGKGVEQKVLSLSDGSMLQVVFQKWLTPKGRNISKQEPVKPDVELDDPAAQDAKALDILLGK